MREDRDKLRELLRATDCVPAAPDCRRAVAERIARPAPRFKLAWAFAAAATALVAMVLGSVVYLGSGEPDGRPTVAKATVRGPKKVTREKQVVPTKRPEKPRPMLAPLPPVPEPSKTALDKPKREPKRVKQAPRMAARTPATEPIEPAPEAVIEYDENAPVALVLVSAPPADDSDTAYQYKETDPETGRVTSCSVTRTGNSVEIFMESTPGEEEPPVKGSLDYENPNA